MHRDCIILLACLVLSGCSDEVTASGDAATDATGEPACDPAYGTLRACVYYDEGSTSGLPNAEVTIRRDIDDVPWLMRVTDDGCVEQSVDVGPWELSAVDEPMGYCRTPFMPIDITACETTSVDVYVLSSCVDG